MNVEKIVKLIEELIEFKISDREDRGEESTGYWREIEATKNELIEEFRFLNDN